MRACSCIDPIILILYSALYFKQTNIIQGSGKWVYIRGIPADCTDDELRDHMSKAGVIATDPVSQAPRLKLYRYVHTITNTYINTVVILIL
jgi:RNA recognition motif-containing protein